MKTVRPPAILLALLFWAWPTLSAPNPLNIPDPLDSQLRAGFYSLYNLDFDTATVIFQTANQTNPDQPMVSFGLASVYWWKLSVEVLENDPVESQPFLLAAEASIKLAESRVAAGDETGEAHLTLGTAHGLLGRWEATNGHWLLANRRGKLARKYLKLALKINPQLADANMALGIFDYILATLPGFVRMLSDADTPDPRVGIQELTTAANQGTYMRTPAALLLANIYSGREKKPELALDIIYDLRAEYPNSPFIHMMAVTALYNQNNLAVLDVETQNFLINVASGVYRAEFVTEAHFARGAYYFKNRQWAEAINEYEQGIAVGNERDPFYAWSYLYKGYAFDMIKKRNEAKLAYRKVLKQRKRWRSHDFANRRLEYPFGPSDQTHKTLEL